MRILIAEDDVAQQRLLAHLVARWSYQATIVSTGEDAIQMLREHEYSIALIDWNLPGMSGLDVCAAMRDLGRFTHAIVLSARNGDQDIHVALEAGASDYLGKPFDQSELRARLMVGTRMVHLHQQISQMQKLESIGQLAAGIAHEINTPAQFVSDNLRFACDGMRGLAQAFDAYRAVALAARAADFASELVQKAEEAAESHEVDYMLEELQPCLKQSLDGITRIAEIVRAMKSFSHPGVSTRKQIDINEAIESTVTVARHEWKHVATLALELDPNLPQVPCFPGELNQVLLNVLVNAAHAVHDVHGENPQRGALSIASLQRDGHVLVSIRDNGGGIPEAIRERVFDPFFTTKEVGRGTGQGLSIAYDVVTRKHGGRIWFESQEGEGTTFWLQFPLDVSS